MFVFLTRVLLSRFVRMLFINQVLMCSALSIYSIYYYMLHEVCLFNFRNISSYDGSYTSCRWPHS